MASRPASSAVSRRSPTIRADARPRSTGLATGIIAPVLPKLVVGFMGGDTASGFKMLGVFGTVWAAMQFIFSPVLGVLLDRFGRRPMILLANFGLGLDYVLMIMTPSLCWFFVGCAVFRRRHVGDVRVGGCCARTGNCSG